MGGDVLDVLGVPEYLKDGVPIGKLVVDPCLAGEKGVDDRDEELRGLEPRVGFSGPDREGAGPVQVTCAQELVGSVKPPFRFRSATTVTVHFDFKMLDVEERVLLCDVCLTAKSE